MLDKIYEVCKFIVVLCGTIMVLFLTAAFIYMAFN